MRRIRHHLTFANLASGLALFLVLTGASAYALAGHNTVFSDDIVNGEVKSADVQDNGLTGTDVKELTLGKVPNADTLDGKDSSAFLSSGAVHTGLVELAAAGGAGNTQTLFHKAPWTIKATCASSASGNDLTVTVQSSDAGGGIATTQVTAEQANGFGRAGNGPASEQSIAHTGPHPDIYWYGGAPFSLISDTGAVDGVLSYGVNIAGADCAASLLAG